MTRDSGNVNIRDQHPNLGTWMELIDRCLVEPDSEPIVNLAGDEDPEYDAIFIGGGAGGGSAPRT